MFTGMANVGSYLPAPERKGYLVKLRAPLKPVGAVLFVSLFIAMNLTNNVNRTRLPFTKDILCTCVLARNNNERTFGFMYFVLGVAYWGGK